MDNQPIVTIGVPVYNGESFLRQALDSLLAQTYRPIEILIADNASTDSTQSICNDYASRDHRIRYVRHSKNLGATENFNFVFKNCQTKYFKWQASDDICMPEFIERCVFKLEENPNAGWCHSKSDLVDGQGESWLPKLPEDDFRVKKLEDGSRWWDSSPRMGDSNDDPVKRFTSVVLGVNWCVDCYGVFRTESLKKTRMYIDLYGSEKVLLAELALYSKYCHVDELLFQQRLHDQASSFKKKEDVKTDYHAKKSPSKPLLKRILPARVFLIQAQLYSVIRSDLSWFQKLRAMSVGLRYFLQFRKWYEALLSLVKREGTAGGGRRMVETANRYVEQEKPI